MLPDNVGPRTTPNYEANFLSEGVKQLDGGSASAGPRDDPFYIDLGAAFDTLNLAPFFGNPPRPGIDMLAGHNVHTIAIEVPMAMISNGSSVIGAYGFTTRPRVTIRTERGFDLSTGGLARVQVQRLANPLVNELIIGTADKDRWNGSKPDGELAVPRLLPQAAVRARRAARVRRADQVPRPVTGCTPNPPASSGTDLAGFNCTDLQALLLQYNPIVYGQGRAGENSDLLRLNLATPPTPLGQQSSVPGALGGDPAAWPNGRRPKDDVTDIAAKAVGGPNYVPLQTIDGVESNDKAYPAAFPFLASPHDGVTRVHQNR